MISPLSTIRLELERWTGFSHVHLVHSGSAALKLALEVLTGPRARVALPALSCWTITGSILDRGAIPIHVDVDQNLALCGRLDDTDAVVGIDPWARSFFWPGLTSFSGAKILDATLSILGGFSNLRAADVFDGALISLGSGKPWDIGAGGILLLRSEEASRAAAERLLYGRRRLRWAMHADRYVFSSHLLEPMLRRWELVIAERDAANQARAWFAQELRNRAIPLSCPQGHSESAPGYSALVPLLLAPEFPLSAEDVFAVAIAEGVPIGTQPVTPAYQERAYEGPPASCPEAEALSKRLLFVPSRSLDNNTITLIEALLGRLAAEPEAFRRPYPVTARPVDLPEAFAHWMIHGVVCRRVNGEFIVHDPLLGKSHLVTDSVVATLQRGDGDDGQVLHTRR